MMQLLPKIRTQHYQMQTKTTRQSKQTTKLKRTNKIISSVYEKDQNLPNKNFHSINSSGKPLPNNSNYSKRQSPSNPNYRGRSPDQRYSRNFSQNRYSRSNSPNNQ